jgi:hypothetical protein
MTTFFFYYKLCDFNNISRISSIYEATDAYLYGVFDKDQLQLHLENDKLNNQVQGKIIYFPTLSLTDILQKIDSNSTHLNLHRGFYIVEQTSVYEKENGTAYIIL